MQIIGIFADLESLPFQHSSVYSYVPIKVDYSDLYDVMTFFVGTPDGRGSHDDVAAKLAAQGKEWARLHWRKEDMASYMYRLVLGKINNAAPLGKASRC